MKKPKQLQILSYSCYWAIDKVIRRNSKPRMRVSMAIQKHPHVCVSLGSW
jgi:hypothetical protein